jgi:hypothetical protein
MVASRAPQGTRETEFGLHAAATRKTTDGEPQKGSPSSLSDFEFS